MKTVEKTAHHTSHTIEWEASVSLLDGNITLAKDMLKLLYNELTNIKPKIHQLLAEKQSDKLITLLHTLRGGGAYCGVSQLQNSCSAVENALKANTDQDELAPLINALFVQIDAVIAAAPTYLDINHNK